jgi:hypothetical protein
MLLCMRTTLDIHDDLMLQAKKLAAESGRTLTAVVEDALHEMLARIRAARATEKRYALPTFDGGGLMPGVDINNSAALLDIMDQDDGPV